MNPRLVAIAGPLKDQILALTEEQTSIGRDTSNQLGISDRSASRRHCFIVREADRFTLSDLDSLNGTFVNGRPVKECGLEHGDRVKIGTSLFTFLLHEGEIEPSVSQVQLDDGRVVTRATVMLKKDEAMTRMARDLKALLRISTVINSIRGLETLKQKLLELMFEVIPAERGAILLVGESPGEFTSTASLDRVLGPGRQIQVSRTVVNRVLREGVAILSNDMMESEALSGAESLMASSIKSLLCVPLLLFDQVQGVIYLDTAQETARFDQDHLQLAMAIASIAAVALHNARQMEWLESENQRLQEDIDIEHNTIGESPQMREVYQFIAKVASTDSTVLIRGESGTGKELVARAIHANSSRASKPFVAINCAALTETLLESELFGHEKGAFTGAVAQKKGKLEVADGGTVFLDEVGELAPALQAKLLRVLQEREFERVGGTRPIKVDVRLIAATNEDLEETVRQGTFRQDLYYRLNVVSLTMPLLRGRREDIPLLTSYFVSKYSQRCKRRVMGISAEARTYLLNYDWPGNVRELENAIERAVVLGTSEVIRPEDLPEPVLERPLAAGVSVANYHEAINDLKKQLILKAVEQAGGNYTEAANRLGIHPKYLHRLIRNLNLRTALKQWL